MCERFARIASNLRFAVLAPESAIHKERVQFGNPATIRENQAMRANLRIDLRESGHLSAQPSLQFIWFFMLLVRVFHPFMILVAFCF